MPRLTNNDYINQRQQVRDLWLNNHDAVTRLNYNQQMELAAFFAPHEDFTPDQAIAHRQQVTADHPSLPQRAGKLYQRLEAMAQAPEQARVRRPAPHATAGTPHGRRQTRVRIQGLARPEPDYDRLVRAILDAVRDMEEEESGRKKAA